MAFLSEAKKKRTGGVVWKNVCCVHVHPQLLFFPTHLHCPEPWPWTHHTASAAAKGAALLDNIKGEKVRKCRSVHRLSAWLSRLAAALHFSSQSVLWRTCEESTWHFTSEPPGLRAPDTHRLLFRGFFFYLTKCRKLLQSHTKLELRKSRRGEKATNLFHPPRRVQTDPILDPGRFQSESVWHVHTQHCHFSETRWFPALTPRRLPGVDGHGRVVLWWWWWGFWSGLFPP